MKRAQHVVAWAVLAAILWSAQAQSEDAPSAPPSQAEFVSFDEALVSRLLALRPDAPMEYFELGEDIAAQEQHAEGRRLARGPTGGLGR